MESRVNMSIPGNVSYVAQGGTGWDGADQYTTGESWDLQSFLENSTDYLMIIGGSLLALVGGAAVIWGFVNVMRKLFGGQSGQQIQWFTTILLIIVGGAFLVGGITLALNFASGAGDTVTGFGTGG